MALLTQGLLTITFVLFLAISPSFAAPNSELVEWDNTQGNYYKFYVKSEIISPAIIKFRLTLLAWWEEGRGGIPWICLFWDLCHLFWIC